jgi:RNA polymerase sigma factor (sigma-70 family)
MAALPDRGTEGEAERLREKRGTRRDRGRKRRLASALKKLTAVERKTVELAILQGVSLHTVATRLGVDRSNLRRILRRAVERLRHELR